MLEVSDVEVFNFEGAIRGMRNPMNSWNRSDSYYGCSGDTCDFCMSQEECINVYHNYRIGQADLQLMRKLYKGGSEHRKYLRQIIISMDILAPLYWWKEFDTYKVGTVANSCSTMHKIHAKEFTLDDFSHEHLDEKIEMQLANNDSLKYDVYITNKSLLQIIISTLNVNRKAFIETNDKKYWWQMIQLLPSSYNQLRTVTMNYENAVNIIKQRSNHKLDEWHILIKELKEQCPYLKAIMSE